MSSVAMRIEVEPGPWSGDEYRNCWPIGGEIAGQVHVSSADGQKARNVYVELEWFTRGRGDRDRGEIETAGLIEGPVMPATNRSFPFRFRVPIDGPISHQGHLIQVVWQLRACVNVPWGKDIEETVEISVLPA